MRKLASFDDPTTARTLCEVLYAANIDSDLREGDGRSLSVWVLSEADMPRAEAIYRAYAAEPHATAYAGAAAKVASQNAPARTSDVGPPPPVPQAKKSLRQRAIESPITFGAIAVCIVVALITQLGHADDVVSYFTIASLATRGSSLDWSGYRDILNGEVWRVITPIFLHFGPFHILFNMFWMNDLGAPTERIQGSASYAVFMVWSAAVSNIAQFAFGHSAAFGGMSGIIYALVGYLWARGRADPQSGIYLPGRFVLFFVGWMALGWTSLLDDVVGPMANYCHLGGFLAGIAYGYAAALIARGRRRR